MRCEMEREDRARKRIMGSFSVDAKEFYRAYLLLKQMGCRMEGRNSVLLELVRIASEKFLEERREYVSGPDELTYEKAQEKIDEIFPVGNYYRGKKLSGKERDARLSRLFGGGGAKAVQEEQRSSLYGAQIDGRGVDGRGVDSAEESAWQRVQAGGDVEKVSEQVLRIHKKVMIIMEAQGSKYDNDVEVTERNLEKLREEQPGFKLDRYEEEIDELYRKAVRKV